MHANSRDEMRARGGDVGLDLYQQVEAPPAPLAMTDDEQVACYCTLNKVHAMIVRNCAP